MNLSEKKYFLAGIKKDKSYYMCLLRYFYILLFRWGKHVEKIKKGFYLIQ